MKDRIRAMAHKVRRTAAWHGLCEAERVGARIVFYFIWFDYSPWLGWAFLVICESAAMERSIHSRAIG